MNRKTRGYPLSFSHLSRRPQITTQIQLTISICVVGDRVGARWSCSWRCLTRLTRERWSLHCDGYSCASIHMYTYQINWICTNQWRWKLQYVGRWSAIGAEMLASHWFPRTSSESPDSRDHHDKRRYSRCACVRVTCVSLGSYEGRSMLIIMSAWYADVRSRKAPDGEIEGRRASHLRQSDRYKRCSRGKCRFVSSRSTVTTSSNVQYIF